MGGRTATTRQESENATWKDRSKIAAILVIDDHGALTVWTNDRLVQTAGQHRTVEVWVRLTIVRGRRFAIWTADDMAA